MTRRSGTSRVGGGGSPDRKQQPYEPPRYPSFRERKPLMFWMVMTATAAMVLATVAGFVSAFL